MYGQKEDFPVWKVVWPFMKRIWHKVIVPHPSVEDFGERRRAQLLMSLALLLAAMSSAGTIASLLSSGRFKFSNSIMLILAIVSWSTYVVGRTGFHRWGSFLLSGFLSLAGYLIVLGGSDDPAGALFAMIPLALILGSVLLPVQAQALLTCFNVLATVVVGIIDPGIHGTPTYAAVFFTIGGLLIVFTIFRDSLEKQRVTELVLLNNELIDIQTTLEQRVDERTRAAEQALEQAQASRRELEDQAWFVRGQLELESAMRGELKVRELADRIIRHLCRYLDIQSGILYIRFGDQFRPVGTFVAGQPSEEQLPQFEMGEGVVGQAAYSQEHILIKSSSVERLAVFSCLGELVPRQVLIYPILHEGQTSAVIELGSLAEFSGRQIEFMDRVAPGISVAIHMAHTRAQVRLLRAESDRLDWETQSGE